MTCPIGVFDAANVIVMVTYNNVVTRLTGFGDGDYVSIDPSSEDATITTGADGRHVANYTANKGVNIRITLQTLSESNRKLKELSELRAQFEFSVSSPDTGESGYTSCAIITARPNLAFGTDSGTREYTIFGGDWVDNNVSYQALT